jgi:spore coat protein U-like protein
MRLIASPVVVLTALLTATSAWGQTCTVSATGVAFGIYNPLATAPTDSTASITVSCQAAISVLVSYTIQLGAGGSGIFSQRSMGGLSMRLGYQLYRDLLRTQVWGNGTSGTFTVADGYLLSVLVPVVRTYTAYGRIPTNEQVLPGSYSDTVTVLLTY